MANILARFRRGRTKSLSGASALTPSGPTLQTSVAAPAPLTVPQAPSPPLERRIHPDLDSLVANWTPPTEPASSTSPPEPISPTPFSTALRPSTRRHSVDGATPVSRPPAADPPLEALQEVPVPIPPPQLTRARRLFTHLTGSSTPPSSSTNPTTSVGGWSTFGRRAKKGGDSSRPHLTEFGEHGRGSPAPSQRTSVSHSISHSVPQSRSPSQANLGTPSTISQQLDDSISSSAHGHGHPMTPASELPSPSSGFTFGSQGRVSGRASVAASSAPPMPSLDHPAFRGSNRVTHSASQSRTPSQLQLPQPSAEARPRSSSSLPSMHSSSRRKRRKGTGEQRAKAQDVFSSLWRGGSRRRPASEELRSSEVVPAPGSREVVLTLGASEEVEGKQDSREDQIRLDSGDLRGGDFKFDARAKRVGASSDTQAGEPFAWPDIPPVHSTESSSSTMDQRKATSLLPPPSLSFIAATPEASPIGFPEASADGSSAVPTPPPPTRSPSDGRGKRKADAADRGSTPSKAAAALEPRSIHPSHSTSSSQAPSSFHRQKRVKVGTSDPTPPRPPSRSGSVSAANTGSASSRGSAPRQQSGHPSRAPSRMSQASLPISALVAPHAPSVVRSGMGTIYHMQNPQKPPRSQPTGWGLEFGEGASPVHAWLFFIGFVLFPVWWLAGFGVPVPQTRRLGDEEEKGREQVVLDDPQVEFDAKSWRKRCRIMAGVSLVTYLPFIVVLAVLLSRR
ncbi:WD-REPEATS-REGION domain-containing protein [Mycena sanguinolenta]|uniref:WD-REPEATS-REGION domain-containing protein n=1 Tax=Mycena sanguinolenta TaxID=230812 RepID=A0A8H6YEV5_9AGAR|nr:WD-REPEATS-REGION domain-containing protein [Mycena sanguinolenta]